MLVVSVDIEETAPLHQRLLVEIPLSGGMVLDGREAAALDDHLRIRRLGGTPCELHQFRVLIRTVGGSSFEIRFVPHLPEADFPPVTGHGRGDELLPCPIIRQRAEPLLPLLAANLGSRRPARRICPDRRQFDIVTPEKLHLAVHAFKVPAVRCGLKRTPARVIAQHFAAAIRHRQRLQLLIAQAPALRMRADAEQKPFRPSRSRPGGFQPCERTFRHGDVPLVIRGGDPAAHIPDSQRRQCTFQRTADGFAGSEFQRECVFTLLP